MSNSKFAAALIVIALAIGPANAALAVTNPASNPSPITVTGDDGNTYYDGADTLPGFDDEECTYIPGTFFDFANNKVHYADGKSIHWTEWERATGYKDWQAKQSQVSSPTQSTSPSASTSTSTKKSKTSTSLAKPVATVIPTSSATRAPTVEIPDQELVGYQNLQLEASENPGHFAGLAILSFLFATGVLLTISHGIRTRISKRGTS